MDTDPMTSQPRKTKMKARLKFLCPIVATVALLAACGSWQPVARNQFGTAMTWPCGNTINYQATGSASFTQAVRDVTAQISGMTSRTFNEVQSDPDLNFIETDSNPWELALQNDGRFYTFGQATSAGNLHGLLYPIVRQKYSFLMGEASATNPTITNLSSTDFDAIDFQAMAQLSPCAFP